MKLNLTFIFCLFLTVVKAQWQWANVNAGGSISDRNIISATDNSGNIYLSGEFEGSKSFGSYTLSAVGTTDVFVAMYDATGNCLWAIQGGGVLSTNKGEGIAVDNSGYVYLTGNFSGEINFGGNNLTQVLTTNNGFIAKFDPSGNCMFLKPVYSKLACVSTGLAVDGSGNLVITGAFLDSTFFDSFALTSVNNSGPDIFIAKFNPSGNFLWAKSAGGPGDDSGFDVATDASGHIYITGVFKQTAAFGTHNVQSFGDYDIFVARYDANGNNIYVQGAGSTTGDQGTAISCDNSGNAYITGYFYPSPQGMNMLPAHFGTFLLPDNGSGNMFVAKYDSIGTCVWAKHGGGSQHDEGLGISTDVYGNSYVTGFYQSTTPTTGPATFMPFSLYSKGGSDAFIVKYNKFGTPVFAQKIGGSATDKGKSIISYPNGDCVVAGNFADTLTVNTTPPTPLSALPQWRVFLAKYSGGSVGIQDIKSDDATFQLYPNPASDILSLSFNDNQLSLLPMSYDIINVEGNIVMTESNIIPDTFSDLQINTRTLAAGSYILRVVNSKTVVNKKFLIIR
jgi:hypothetical protein